MTGPSVRCIEPIHLNETLIAARSGRKPVAPRTLVCVVLRRSVIDYALARRATLESLSVGGASPNDVCDADPYLLRAAKYHGAPAGRGCPVCRRSELREVTYAFGDELGQYSGRIKSAVELEEMAGEHGEFRVYAVEVCLDCSWNHLTTSYVLGDGVPRRPPRRRRTVEDVYGR